MIKTRYAPYMFLLPAVVLLLIFKVYPIVLGLKNSLYAPGFIAENESFVGLGNYLSLFMDPMFWNSVYSTIFFNVFVNPIQITLAFLLAILLNTKLKGTQLFRSLNFIPIAVSLPIACILWNIMQKARYMMLQREEIDAKLFFGMIPKRVKLIYLANQ
jgi:multiple sugar transport system permease protein